MQLFHNLKIRSKLMILVVILLISSLGIWFIGTYNLERSNEALDTMYEENLKPIRTLSSLSTNIRAIESDLFRIILETSDSENQQIIAHIDTTVAENNALIESFEKFELTDNQKSLFEDLKSNITVYRTEREKVLVLALQNKQAEAYEQSKKIFPVILEINEITKELNDLTQKLADDSNLEAKERAESAHNLMLVTLAVAIILAIGLSIFIIRSITKPLDKLTKVTANVAKGDLTEELHIETKDEVGVLAHSITEMIQNLKILITNISSTSQELTASAEELSASAEQTADSTNQITMSIQEIASGTEKQLENSMESARAMEENAQGVGRVAESAYTVAEAANGTLQQAIEGNKIIESAVEQMTTIDHSVQHSIGIIRALEESSKEISNILTLIMNIADQTNLLALNASIEAARAGEHGKGFSVVAEEIRKLAEQTAQSTSKVTNLVQEIQKYSSTSVESMNQVNTEVHKGISAVQNSGEAFRGIVEVTSAAVEKIEEVSAVAQQMSASSEQITASVVNIADISKHNNDNTQSIAAASEEQAATMEEITASAESLSKMAEQLQKLITAFKV
ncbi:methyl-accepting chemotaxis protein [Bacillus sp. 31A1R]|uniref:Methyl-accepting chemotaxis protein n=1 Tax=Robertmurraya mangrovi TaxID=3098077 RepID=A0ABU5IW59_9BACI|nr:methyl-accepting chemotaxis protein [Bacillus sp. 31A1R]MDZ5471394.1 methyl-accepting chemotaxis protein [Bacillus sp. 31A1R]